MSSDSTDLDASTASLASGSYVYGTIPVDVVVYIRVQPSLIRFSCVPVSRVECLLRLPSLDLVFSTKRSDVESSLSQSDMSTPATKPKRKILMSQHVISIREIIAITLTMAKRTDFVDRPAPVDGLSTEGCDPETICCQFF